MPPLIPVDTGVPSADISTPSPTPKGGKLIPVPLQPQPSTSQSQPTAPESLWERIGDAVHVVGSGIQHTSDTLNHIEDTTARAIFKSNNYSHQHPFAFTMRTLGAPQRGIGEIVRQGENIVGGKFKGIPHAVDQMARAVFNPTQKIQEQTTASIERLVHAPAHEAVRKWADSLPLPSNMKSLAKQLSIGTEDTAAQTLSDPLTFADTIIKGAEGVGSAVDFLKSGAAHINAAEVSKAFFSATRGLGSVSKAFDFLADESKVQKTLGYRLGHYAARIRDAGQRPELQRLFTPRGESIRRAIEDKFIVRYAHDTQRLQNAGERAVRGDKQAESFLHDEFVHLLYTNGTESERDILTREYGYKPRAANEPHLRHDKLTRERTVTVDGKEVKKTVPRSRVSIEKRARARIQKEMEWYENASPELRGRIVLDRMKRYQKGLANEYTLALYRRNPALVLPKYSSDEAEKIIQRLPLESRRPIPGDSPDMPEKFGTDVNGKAIRASAWFNKHIFQSSQRLVRLSVVIGSPWIHELRNIGKFATAAGGLDTVPKAIYRLAQDFTQRKNAEGLASALRNPWLGVDNVLGQRMARMGAFGTMFHDSESEWLDSLPAHVQEAAKKLPGFLKQIPEAGASTAFFMQSIMRGLDNAFRGELLEKYDKVLGDSLDRASKDVAQEYHAAGKQATGDAFERDVRTRYTEFEHLKAHHVTSQLGDPRNVDFIVKGFRSIGGYFASFRLGIVPRNYLAMLLDNPAEALRPIRFSQNLNAERAKEGLKPVTIGGPATDFTDLVTHPTEYLTSPSTLGISGYPLRYLEGKLPPNQVVPSVASGFIPGGYAMSDMNKYLKAYQQSGNPTDLHTALFMGMLDYFYGVYERNPKTPRTMEYYNRRIDKEFPISNE